MTLHAVYPPTQYLAVKVRLFIDFLVGRFSSAPPWKVKA
jgi:DNA-binding transcriptional LysR family regulator